MTTYWLYTFSLKKPSDERKILHFLKQNDVEIISTSKEGVTLELFTSVENLDNISEISPFFSSKKEMAGAVDWIEQAELFAPKTEEGYIVIRLKNGKTFRLIPGNAFGDASHPTTTLVLDELNNYVEGKTVFDIGTGSAILAIGAALLGAREVFGVEIDPNAIEIAKQNITLNKLENMIFLGKDTPQLHQHLAQNKELVIVANMISSQMRHVFTEYRDFFKLPGTIILSGILKSEKKEFLKELIQMGFSTPKISEKNGWLCFIISCRGNCKTLSGRI